MVGCYWQCIPIRLDRYKCPDMDATLTLPYAPGRRRPIRRAILKLIPLVAVIGTGIWSYREISRRVAILESDPTIGPVDWPAVLTSPTLLKAAWQLSSKPKYPDAMRILGVEPGAVGVDLKLPIRWQDGKARFEVVITNWGSRSLVVPPFRTGGRIPRDVGCMGASVYALPGPFLGRGLQVVGPGESTIIELSVPANRRPANTLVNLYCGQKPAFFEVSAGGGLLARYPFAKWEDVPEKSVRRLRLVEVSDGSYSLE